MDNEAQIQKFKKVWLIWNLVEAVLVLAAGALAIVFGIINDPNNQQQNAPIQVTIAAVIGGFVILDGLLRIVTVLLNIKKTEQSVMLIGGFEITAGIVVILFRDMFVQLIVTFLSVFLIVIGTLMLIFSIYAIAKKVGKLYMPVLEIIFGALLLALGIAITIMYYSGDNSNKIVLIVIGVIMVAFGITQAIIAIVSYKKKTVIDNDIMPDAGKSTAPVVHAEQNSPKKHEGKREQEQPKEDDNIIEIEAEEPPLEIEGHDAPKAIEHKPEDKKESRKERKARKEKGEVDKEPEEPEEEKPAEE